MATTAQDESPHDLNCLTIAELATIAADKMDKQTRDYYNEGADSGTTLQENSEAYNKYRIRPRVLRDISAIDTSTMIFGHRNSMPLGVAPTAVSISRYRVGHTCIDELPRCIAWHTPMAK